MQNVRRKTKQNRNASDFWWLRSPGYGQVIAAQVGSDGNMYSDGDRVNYECGIRPALTIEFE